MKGLSFHAIRSVAYKEFLHIYRDRRILLLLLILPPLFTLLFGYAFEGNSITDIKALLTVRDNSDLAGRFVDIISKNKTFIWRRGDPNRSDEADLLKNGVKSSIVIPAGWGDSLSNGDPMPLPLYLDGTDINTADAVEGGARKSLADFQLAERDRVVQDLPDSVVDLGKKLPIEVRKQFVSLMESWSVKRIVLYNPEERFIDYVTPGIIGLILQLLTVTLMACTIARERESGTLYQLMVTSLKRWEIVIGKMLPYLAISACLIAVIAAVAGLHFKVPFHNPIVLAVICLLFLLCSLGLGLLISAISRTQTQAIQFSVFFLLPVFVLSGAFAPLDQLPQPIQYVSEIFPLTQFCRAFRLVNMYRAGPEFYFLDLIVLAVGAGVTFLGAALLLRRIEE